MQRLSQDKGEGEDLVKKKEQLFWRDFSSYAIKEIKWDTNNLEEASGYLAEKTPLFAEFSILLMKMAMDSLDNKIILIIYVSFWKETNSRNHVLDG
jgi:hypothetical protein